MKILLSAAAIILTAFFFVNCSPTSSSSTSADSCPSTNYAYAVDTSNNLLCFSLTTPATIARTIPLTGLGISETVKGMDFRPGPDTLHVLGSSGQVYTVNLSTGVATALGIVHTFTGATNYGFDFNPTVDRIRAVTNNQLNKRINPNDGALTSDDIALNYAGADPNFGATPNVVAAAYINNSASASTTVVYAIDVTLDILATINLPNAGTLNTVGSLGVNTDANTSFDVQTVASTNTAYAVLTPAAGITSSLYTVDLTTGAATLVNVIAGGNAIVAFAVAP